MKSLQIVLKEHPEESYVSTAEGEHLPVTCVDVGQDGRNPPVATLRLELLSLCASIYADRCAGQLDPATMDMLHRLPSGLISDLAKDMARVAEDVRFREQEAARYLAEKVKKVS